MRIADVSGFYSEQGGGVRSYVNQKFEAAARAGHDLTVIAPGEGDRVEERQGGRVMWVASPLMPFDPKYRRFSGRRGVFAALDAAAPDLVEGSSPWLGGELAGAWPGKARRSLVFHQDVVAGYGYTALLGPLSTERIDALAEPWWRRVRRLAAHYDVTVAASEWLAGRLVRHGVANARAVPFGIEAGAFSPAKRDEALRRELLASCGVRPEGRLILSVGRFHPEKRHATLIEGFRRARERVPELALVLAGDGLLRERVARRAVGAGGVRLLGEVRDRERLARLYASADLLIHGSGAETFGLVVAEAMASGLPVIVPEIGGAADLAARGRSRLYPLGDAQALAEAIVAAARAGWSVDPHPQPPPLAEDHFRALFDLYQDLVDGRPA